MTIDIIAALSMKKKYFIHKTALVETEKIGDDSRIWAFVHILPGAKIGRNANICDHCFIENDVVIGDNVTIKTGVSLWDGITIKDNVSVGPNAVFTNDRYPRSKNRAYLQEKILLKNGCSIGANATILAGITIGEHTMVGAGSVVTKNIGNFELVYGNPATRHGFICICTKKMTFKNKHYTCICKRKYEKIGDAVTLMP